MMTKSMTSMGLSLKRCAAMIVIAAFATLLTACAGSPSQSSTGEYVDDSVITTKIKSEFVKDETVKALDVHVRTFKGKVQLSGFVKTQAEKNRAGEIAKSVEGVVAVDNGLVVKGN
ncbi:MAG TPA: BON domain-containing protein [Burkholderiales bacterium]|nr:BON domain-containing protein [Burkholderiales bacterium]